MFTLFSTKSQVECQYIEKVALYNCRTLSNTTEFHCKLWSHCAKTNTAEIWEIIPDPLLYAYNLLSFLALIFSSIKLGLF